MIKSSKSDIFKDPRNICKASPFKPETLKGEVERIEFADDLPACIFRIKDESMYPLLKSGDFLVCFKSDDVRSLPYASLSVVNFQGKSLIKRICRKGDEVILSADHWACPDIKATCSDLSEVWAVPADFDLEMLVEKTMGDRRLEQLEREVKKIRSTLQSFRNGASNSN